MNVITSGNTLKFAQPSQQLLRKYYANPLWQRLDSAVCTLFLSGDIPFWFVSGPGGEKK